MKRSNGEDDDHMKLIKELVVWLILTIACMTLFGPFIGFWIVLALGALSGIWSIIKYCTSGDYKKDVEAVRARNDQKSATSKPTEHDKLLGKYTKRD